MAEGEEQDSGSAGGAAAGMMSEADSGGVANSDTGGAGDSPDTSSLPPNARPATPPPGGNQATPPAQPVSPHAGRFDQILTMLGGGPKKTYAVDPATGKMTMQELPPSRGDSIKMILAGALTGLAAGSQVHGPGAALGSFGAGFDKTAGQAKEGDQQAQQQAIEQAKRQQQIQQQNDQHLASQAATFETNQRTALLSRQAEQADQTIRQNYVDTSAPVIESARDAEVNGVSTLKREHLTQGQLIQEHSADGARHATSNVYLPDGLVPVMDPKTGKPQMDANGAPKMEYTYAELDPHAEVDLDGKTLDTAVANGYAVPGYVPGAGSNLKLPVKDAANLVHFNQGIQNFTHLTNEMNTALGLKGTDALDPQAMLKTNPQLGNAISQLASHWDGQPSKLPAALESMQAPLKNGKPNPAAPYARTVANAIGGNRMDEFAEQVKVQNEAKEEAGKAAAKEPFEVDRENRVAARQEDRDDRKAHAKDDQLVIAGMPNSDETQVMRKGDLPQGWLQYPLKDPEQLTATIRRTNDVQTKINALANFVQNGGMDHIQPGLVGDAIAEVNNQIKVGAFGAELPTARINAILDKENYGAMNKASRDYVRAYGFAREAMTQLPALQSYGKSNRMNETQLKAALQLLPDGRMDSKSAMDQMNALQDVFDPLRKLPKGLPGAGLTPSFREQQQQQRPAAGGAGQPAADPFAAFGGKARPPAQTQQQPQ
jgi:hypothetical protein